MADSNPKHKSRLHLAPVPSVKEYDPHEALFVALFGHKPKMPKPKLRPVK